MRMLCSPLPSFCHCFAISSPNTGCIALDLFLPYTWAPYRLSVRLPTAHLEPRPSLLTRAARLAGEQDVCACPRLLLSLSARRSGSDNTCAQLARLCVPGWPVPVSEGDTARTAVEER